ncbi:MAG: pyruvate kinase [Parcubacteria group bacterium]|nr:pyruvate kinase [Parcubacteria group bacterium]
MKKTKIVCTIGPASREIKTLRKMIVSGMNVARLNFSHGTHEEHLHLIRNIRKAAHEEGADVAILQDLQGPRIRVGDVEKEGISIRQGEHVALVSERYWKKKSQKSVKIIPQQYAGLYDDVKIHDTILIEDGTKRLKVEGKKGGMIFCKVIVGGTVYAHKGINVPGATLRASAITEKDIADIRFGCENDVDYIALSFVRSAKDLMRLRELIQKFTPKKFLCPAIVPKIERQEAIDDFPNILVHSDAIMYARGDLALEIPAQEVPILQKKLIMICLEAARPIIVATQMLESMKDNIQPTRAELSDVANAVIDHTDAIMLSGETAGGKYPVETVEFMAKVAREAENSPFDDMPCHEFPITSLSGGLARSVCFLAPDTGISKVVVLSDDMKEITLFARHRGEMNIIALVSDEKRMRQCQLIWGVTASVLSRKVLENPTTDAVVKFLGQKNILRKGERCILCSHAQTGKKEHHEELNFVKIEKR